MIPKGFHGQTELWTHPEARGYLVIIDSKRVGPAWIEPPGRPGPRVVVAGLSRAIDLGWILLDEGYTPKPVAVA